MEKNTTETRKGNPPHFSNNEAEQSQYKVSSNVKKTIEKNIYTPEEADKLCTLSKDVLLEYYKDMCIWLTKNGGRGLKMFGGKMAYIKERFPTETAEIKNSHWKR